MRASDVGTPRNWSERTIELDEDQLTAMVHQFHVVVVDCWAPWCMHSRKMSSVFEETAADMRGRAAFGRISAAENHHVPVKYGVRATPTFLVFKEGEVVGRLEGETSKSELQAMISRCAQV